LEATKIPFHSWVDKLKYIIQWNVVQQDKETSGQVKKQYRGNLNSHC
jgi:hypothetical protein